MEISRKVTVEKGSHRKTDRLPVIRVKSSIPLSWISISMWPSVAAINHALKMFCERHRHMIFFDSYDVFVDPSKDIPRIIPGLMGSTLGQPSPLGHDILLQAISQKMKSIYEKISKDDLQSNTFKEIIETDSQDSTEKEQGQNSTHVQKEETQQQDSSENQPTFHEDGTEEKSDPKDEEYGSTE